MASAAARHLGHADCLAVLELIQHCCSARGQADEIATVFSRLGRLMPMDAAVIAQGRAEATGPVTLERLHCHGPDAWLQPYREAQLEQCDPVVARARCDATPFRWSEARHSHPCVDRRYLELKEATGRTEGIAAACHGRRRNGLATLVSVAMAERRPADRHLHILGQVLPHVHQMLAADAPPASPIRLTPRELEVLRWLMDGHSNGEIGRHLSLSERTVKFHLSNAFAKLQVANRPQAVAKALRLGLLQV